MDFREFFVVFRQVDKRGSPQSGLLDAPRRPSEDFSYINADHELNKRIVESTVNAYRVAARLDPYNPYHYADLGRFLSRWNFMDRSRSLLCDGSFLRPVQCASYYRLCKIKIEHETF